MASALVSLPVALLTDELAASLTRARTSAETLEGVMEAATQTAIITTDLVGNVTSFNAGAENLLGWTAADVVGHATPGLVARRRPARPPVRGGRPGAGPARAGGAARG